MEEELKTVIAFLEYILIIANIMQLSYSGLKLKMPQYLKIMLYQNPPECHKEYLSKGRPIMKKILFW